MYPLQPENVYVHETVAGNELYMGRVNRVIAALEKPVVPTVYADVDLPEMISNGLMAKRGSMGTLDEIRDPSLLFNTFRFDDQASERIARLVEMGVTQTGSLTNLLGHQAFRWANYNQEGDPNRGHKVCRPCWRIHQQNGCVHRCHYCGLGGLLIAGVNVEEYCHWLGKLIEMHPWQLTYLLDDDGDPPGLEPELGCLGELIEFFGTLENRYLIIHTKTWNTEWNTEWIRELRHNGNTIIVWSVSGPNQSRFIEPRTGTTEERIEAARIAQEAGYQIRYKFKPIIPVKGWEEDAAFTAKLMFERTDPDVISLCSFMWMDIDDLKRRLPVEHLDPAFLAAAEEAKDTIGKVTTRPFPPIARQRIYETHLREIRRWNEAVPVSLSTESFDMWKSLGDAMGFSATDYPCGCGPFTVPGAPTLACHPFRTATRMDNGRIPCVTG